MAKQTENRLDANDRQMLLKAMQDFSLRVLSGKNCSMQETATLPAVLSLLLRCEYLDQ